MTQTLAQHGFVLFRYRRYHDRDIDSVLLPVTTRRHECRQYANIRRLSLKKGAVRLPVFPPGSQSQHSDNRLIMSSWRAGLLASIVNAPRSDQPCDRGGAKTHGTERCPPSFRGELVLECVPFAAGARRFLTREASQRSRSPVFHMSAKLGRSEPPA